jgi:Tfp pilus assembly protein PilW
MIEIIITGLIGLIVFYFLLYIVMAQHRKAMAKE